jgi:hypothetical protein
MVYKVMRRTPCRILSRRPIEIRTISDYFEMRIGDSHIWKDVKMNVRRLQGRDLLLRDKKELRVRQECLWQPPSLVRFRCLRVPCSRVPCSMFLGSVLMGPTFDVWENIVRGMWSPRSWFRGSWCAVVCDVGG